MISRFLLGILFVVSFAASSIAGEFATMDEAKAMAERAAKHVQSAGVDTAAKDFMTPGGDWHDRDLYVFVFDKDGTTIAHGAKAALVGRNLTSLRDVDGKAFMQEFLAVQDTAWVDYKWQNPTTNKVDPKSSYIIRVGENIVGVGAYKQ